MPLLETVGSGSAKAFGLNSSSGGLVTSQLLVNYDFGPNGSNNGSNTTVLDLSGNGYNGSLTSAGLYNSANKAILLPGNNTTSYMTGSGIAWQNLTSANAWSIEWVIKDTKLPNGDAGFFASASTSNVDNVVTVGSNPDTPNNRRTMAYALGSGSQVLVSGADPFWNTNEAIQLLMTWDGTNIKVYKNGTLSATYTLSVYDPSPKSISRWIIGQESDGSDSAGWSFDPTQAFGGYIYANRLYNKVMSSAEVLQNYNYAKARFGI
jgi:hypothetical protein